VLVAGHRAGLMAQMDRIAVLNDGALQAFGPPAEVLAKGAGIVRALPKHPMPTAAATRESKQQTPVTAATGASRQPAALVAGAARQVAA
jgi:ABC-type protease/lipase transport system fused ATPase/permease subunit